MSLNIAKVDKKRVVIVGGGFGGLKLANKLKKSGFQVVLIDKNNYHQFPPLIYQVASAGMEPTSISFPFRKIFQHRKDFYFRMAEVRAIFPEKNMRLPLGKPNTITSSWRQALLLTFSVISISKKRPCR